MEREEKINLIISNEDLAKQILKAINQSYGKKFIEDTLSDNQVQKKERHNTYQIIEYYNLQMLKFPTKQRKQIRIMTALHFNISEKVVQYHITKCNSL
ncbi:MAG: hypothetical protein PHD79_08840 [Aliarcobacter sp.]|nr:hypothetical protein [Aliarcobacter sp.]